ncbi:MAG: SDR family NAD(P)-dependent oxidoreductase [Bacteroidales bacterium]|nr:SDR family NAD(P)-dependent oxidoreductase [Bacteroidales bacterium]
MENNKYAVVTGASSGIGKAIASELASRKYNLVLHSLPSQGLKAYCEELTGKHGIEALFYETDLTLEKGPRQLYEFVREKRCSVSVLVNNAGIGFEGPIDNYSEDQIDKMILLNIRALTMLTFYFASALKKNDPAYLLNISSLGCYLPTAYKSIYLASKSYIYFFTRALESELKGSSVRTCVIAPSAVRTNKVVLDRIRKHGWFSAKTALDPAEVAAESLKGMFRGRRVIIPGRMTRLLFAAGLFVPEGIMMLITRRIFSNFTNEPE